MKKLPSSVVLQFDGDENDFEISAEVHYTDDDVVHSFELGSLHRAEDDPGWNIIYGDGLSACVSGVIENLTESKDDENDEGGDEEDGDEDEDPPQEDDDDPSEHESGRKWHEISKTSDSLVRAMDICEHTNGLAMVMGCLVLVETFGDNEGEYSSSTQFLKGLSLSDLKIEP